MRTNIDIDDALVREAMALSGAKTKKAAIEEAMQFFIRLKNQRKALDEIRGIGWEGDLEEMRLGWPSLDKK
ncbi:MAG: type II toxin-antitoxin system VapB family antitoxin [Rhizobiaceae bacterium]|nr:type II toxin-antitoxin system VapB family antitoxin [Rhizobiaceae bacterium]